MSQRPPPQHIAFIMDGNGRWASRKLLPRKMGHKAGAETVKRVIELSRDFGIHYITLYTFSTENWKRSQEEINDLMQLLDYYIDELSPQLKQKKISFRVIGQLDRLPQALSKKLRYCIEETQNFKEHVLTLALSYGGREEITSACRLIAQKVKDDQLSTSAIDETLFSHYLYTTGIPDPDLIVRTAGEFRLSNFLLWQAAYSEFWSTQTLWPDFDKKDFQEALEFYNSRNRKYGGR